MCHTETLLQSYKRVPYIQCTQQHCTALHCCRLLLTDEYWCALLYADVHKAGQMVFLYNVGIVAFSMLCVSDII